MTVFPSDSLQWHYCEDVWSHFNSDKQITIFKYSSYHVLNLKYQYVIQIMSVGIVVFLYLGLKVQSAFLIPEIAFTFMKDRHTIFF